MCVRQARSKQRAHPYSEEATGCGILPAAPLYSLALTRHTAKTVVNIIGRHHRKYQLGTISGESRSVLVRELVRVFETVLTLELALAKRSSDHENTYGCQNKRPREDEAQKSEPDDNDAAEDIAAEDNVVSVVDDGQEFTGSVSGSSYGGWARVKVLPSTKPSRKSTLFEAMRADTAPAAARMTSYLSTAPSEKSSMLTGRMNPTGERSGKSTGRVNPSEYSMQSNMFTELEERVNGIPFCCKKSSKVIVDLDEAADAVTVAPAAEILPLQKKTHLSLLKKEHKLDLLRYIDAKIEETKAIENAIEIAGCYFLKLLAMRWKPWVQ